MTIKKKWDVSLFYSQTVMIILKDVDKFYPIPIIPENVLPFVPSTGDVIQSGGIFYSNRPTHK